MRATIWTLAVMSGVATGSPAMGQKTRPAVIPDTGLPVGVTAVGKTLRIAGTSKSYTGFMWGGRVTFGPDGNPRLADYPIVRKVEAGSPAEKAGLAAGDVILAMNGKDAREPGAMVKPAPGTPMHIRIQHGQELRDVTLIPIAQPKQ